MGQSIKNKYRGVYWHKTKQKWKSQLKLNGKFIHIGYYDSEEEAKKAYDEFWERHKESCPTMSDAEYLALWKKSNPEKVKEYAQKYYYKHKETISQRRKIKDKEKTERVKKEVIDAYGGRCQCCGENNIKFLTIDHINNDGKEDREENGVGYRFYCWIKRNNFPDHLRLLCFNCNCGRQINGGICPHKEKKNEEKNSS